MIDPGEVERVAEAIRDESARLRKAVEGLLHTIATQVPRDAPFSFMLTRDVAEVSRALVTLSAARAHRGAADASTHAPAWSGEAPKVAGDYLFVDANAFKLFKDYPRVAATPMQAARIYEVTLAATGPRVTAYRAGARDTFDANLLGPGVWLGPLPPPGAAS